MTAKSFCPPKRRIPKEKTASASKLCFGFFLLFCLLLLLRNAEIALQYMSQGLTLCAKSIVPALFPFLVLSELIVGCGLEGRVWDRLLAPLCRIWRLSRFACGVALLGLLCGFPVGVKCAVTGYDRQMLSKDEAERVIAFSGTPSSAFLIGAVGTALLKNRTVGLILYAAMLLTAILTGVLLGLFQKKAYRIEEPPLSVANSPIALPTLFTQAIRASCFSILLISAYVVFFFTLLGTLSVILSPLSLPQPVTAFLFCLFELSGGVHQAAALPSQFSAALLCAFAAGWSGLSVHCQMLSLSDGRGFSFFRYLSVRLLMGAFCMLFAALLLTFIPIFS